MANSYSEMVQDSNPQIPEAQQITWKRNKRMSHSKTAQHHKVKQPGAWGRRVGVGRGGRAVSFQEITGK